MAENPYNGFDYKWRDYIWQVQKWLRTNKLVPEWEGMACDMCGLRSDNCMPHLEDYTKPAEFNPLCIECHMTLHGRFRMPEKWFQLVRNVMAGKQCREYGSPVQPTYKNVQSYFGKSRESYQMRDREGPVPEWGSMWWHYLVVTPITLYPQGFKFDVNEYVASITSCKTETSG